MRRFVLSIVLTLALYPLWGQSESFFFVQISDPQLGFQEEKGFSEGEALLRETIRAINHLHPAFLVITGDMINSSRDTLQLTAYKKCISLIDPDIPIYHVPGNHDVGKYSSINEDFYLSHYGYDRFSFTQSDCAFIGFNSCPIKDNDLDAEEAQYQWLKKELKRNKKARMKFLFLHCSPILSDYYEEESYSNFSLPMRKKYVDLFKRYQVTAVLSGHLHNNSRCNVEGIDFITTGPSGKPLGTGFSGMAIVKVNSKGYSYSFKTAASFLPSQTR